MSCSEPTYSSCSSVTLSPESQAAISLQQARPLPPPPQSGVPLGLTNTTQPPMPTRAHQPQQSKGNANFSLRFILCFIFRCLFILFLFALVFYYFFNQATRLELEQNTARNEIRLTDLPSGKAGSLQRDKELARRRLFIKEMTRNTWSAYVKFAWGQDALETETLSAYSGWLGPNGGLTLLQSMSTLWIMDFTEEFARGRSWIKEHFNFSQGVVNKDVSVFLVVSEVIGPLLSCYALSKDALFLEKAQEVAYMLEPAYKSLYSLPFKKFNPSTGVAFGEEVFLGEVGGQHLEYYYLYSLTKKNVFNRRFAEIRQQLVKLPKPKKGLYLSELDILSVEWSDSTSTFFRPSSTFYSYLVKAYYQSGGADLQALEMYQQAIQAANLNFMFNTSVADLTYVRDYFYLSEDSSSSFSSYSPLSSGTSHLGDFMMHDGCYMGAMLALGSAALNNQLAAVSFNAAFCEGADCYAQSKQQQLNSAQMRKAKKEVLMHRDLAINLTETCRFSTLTRTGLPANYLWVNEPDRLFQKSDYFNEYHLSPELAESYLVLWRLTRNDQYRDWAWQLALSIEANCRSSVSGAYSNIANVEELPTVKVNYQPPHFLGATLKYLYLIFDNTDEEILSLDEWTFNRAGQPLPNCGDSCS